MVLLGEISYPLYLVHGTIGVYLALYLLPLIGAVLSGITGIIASIIASCIITFYFDIPVRRWLKGKLLITPPRLFVKEKVSI